MDERVEFYNKTYTEFPDKWSLPLSRNKMAYYYLSKHIDDPETFLDIGCGNGHTIEYFQKKWPDTAYYGVDLSDKAIELAKERVPTAFFACETIEDFVAYPPIDVVVLMGVAEHFEDLIPSLIKVKKLGKLFYFEVPDLVDNSHHINMQTEEGYSMGTGGQVEWHLRKRTWEERFGWAGFEVVEFYPEPYYGLDYIWVLK